MFPVLILTHSILSSAKSQQRESEYRNQLSGKFLLLKMKKFEDRPTNVVFSTPSCSSEQCLCHRKITRNINCSILTCSLKKSRCFGYCKKTLIFYYQWILNHKSCLSKLYIYTLVFSSKISVLQPHIVFFRKSPIFLLCRGQRVKS